MALKVILLGVSFLTMGCFAGEMVFSEHDARVEISFLTDRIVEVGIYPRGVVQPTPSLVVDRSGFSVSAGEPVDATTFQSKTLRVVYQPKSGGITFSDRKARNVLLQATARACEPVEILGEPLWKTRQTFRLTEDEGIYGLGQYQDGVFNYRGQSADLVHANREIANPVLLSTKGYLIYWDNYSKTTFTDGETGATFASEASDGIRYYFVYGETMRDSVAEFRRLTGGSPMLPKSAFGFWMSKERYKSFEELTGVVAEYRKRGIPLDNIVQDWQYWGEDRGLWNALSFHPARFADPETVIGELHDRYHVKLTVSVWPGVGPKTPVYKELDAAGALFNVRTWAGYKVIDIYNKKAQEIYWNALREGLYSKGVDSWWMDATEPSFRDGLYQSRQEQYTKEAGMTAIGPFHRYLNTYSLVFSRMMYENLRKMSDKRVSILTRSAFAGQQKYGTSTWSGDIYASWDVLRKQVSAGLNFCMTGIPYWTTDIGGFRVISEDGGQNTGAGEIGSYVEAGRKTKDGGYRKGLKDPAYLELYTRWFQYGAFNPMFRAHGTEVPREIWHFGEPGTPYYEAQVKMIALRYSLLSYIYAAAWQVTDRGDTMMRPMVMDFTDDSAVRDRADGFMFGDSLLVYPVLRPMYFDRSGPLSPVDESVPVYLPRHPGGWFDFSGEKWYSDGQTLRYPAPLDTLPLFVKAGAIIPRNNPVQYVGAEEYREMAVDIYAGADAAFTLYEDDNETYAYEHGIFSTIRFSWNDAARTLTISAPEGKMSPVHDRRTFRITLIEPLSDASTHRTVRQVDHALSEINVFFREDASLSTLSP